MDNPDSKLRVTITLELPQPPPVAVPSKIAEEPIPLDLRDITFPLPSFNATDRITVDITLYAYQCLLAMWKESQDRFNPHFGFIYTQDRENGKFYDIVTRQERK